MQPAFHQRRLAALVEGMAMETQISIDHWAVLAAKNQVINMAEETTALAMRVVTRALFSTGVTGGEKRLADAITTIIDEIAFRFDMPFYPPLGFPTRATGAPGQRCRSSMKKFSPSSTSGGLILKSRMTCWRC